MKMTKVALLISAMTIVLLGVGLAWVGAVHYLVTSVLGFSISSGRGMVAFAVSTLLGGCVLGAFIFDVMGKVSEYFNKQS